MSAPMRPDWPVDACKDCGVLTVFDDLNGQPQCVRCFDRAFATARAASLPRAASSIRAEVWR